MATEILGTDLRHGSRGRAGTACGSRHRSAQRAAVPFRPTCGAEAAERKPNPPTTPPPRRGLQRGKRLNLLASLPRFELGSRLNRPCWSPFHHGHETLPQRKSIYNCETRHKDMQHFILELKLWKGLARL